MSQMSQQSSFLSLARKWRPQTFSQLVGHEYTTVALKNAMRQDRMHHAFLFTGTRGVGKTTLARIVAKAVNCLNNENGEPCLKCEMCEQISAGRMLDVVELDAASHTKVDEMREMLDSAKYLPSQGRCKVFIIDEVHMLSKSAFAAMLKTLEEPPEHIKFILATTDPQKLPATIMSRCLCFALRPLERREITKQLIKILKAENCEYSDEATQTVARLARGSMRDALSILEQAIAHGNGKLEAGELRRITGEANMDLLADILCAVANNDVNAIAGFSERLAADNTGLDAALSRLAVLIYKAALYKVAPKAVDDAEEMAVVKLIIPLFSEEDLQMLYEIIIRGRRQMPWAPDEQSGFEMTLLRMALFTPQSSPSQNEAIPSANINDINADNKTADVAIHDVASETEAAQVIDTTDDATQWQQTLKQLTGPALALAEVCTVRHLDADKILLRVDKSYQNNVELLKPQLTAQLQNIFYNNFQVNIETGDDDAATMATTRDLEAVAMRCPFVKDMLAAIPGARIEADSIHKHENENQP